jgi:hypothetical protein
MYIENGITALANAMREVGEAIDAENDQRRVEEVFGLEWGTLDRDTSRIKFTAPTKYSGEQERGWRYSFDGVPEWCEGDYADRHDGNVTYMTLIEIGVTYESYAPEWLRFPDGKVFVRVSTLGPSGERECPGGYDAHDGSGNHLVGEADTAGMHKCPLCEEPAGEPHGHIYVGESFEHVYKHVEFECVKCGLTRVDCEHSYSDDVRADRMCDCAADYL